MGIAKITGIEGIIRVGSITFNDWRIFMQMMDLMMMHSLVHVLWLTRMTEKRLTRIMQDVMRGVMGS